MKSVNNFWSIYTLFPDLKEGRECLFSIVSYDNNPIWLFVRVGWSQSWGKEYKIIPSNSIKRKTCNYIAVIRDTKCIWWKAAIAVICHIHFHILQYSFGCVYTFLPEHLAQADSVSYRCIQHNCQLLKTFVCEIST